MRPAELKKKRQFKKAGRSNVSGSEFLTTRSPRNYIQLIRHRKYIYRTDVCPCSTGVAGRWSGGWWAEKEQDSDTRNQKPQIESRLRFVVRFRQQKHFDEVFSSMFGKTNMSTDMFSLHSYINSQHFLVMLIKMIIGRYYKLRNVYKCSF